jgi:glycosyltransferase involved in cell wall biosynthesis
VHTNHGLPFHRYQPWPLRALYWSLERAAASLTHQFVCVGEEMKRKAIAARLGPAARFEVVYNGFEPEPFAAARSARSRLGIPEEATVAGVVSRMASHKGQCFLVEAAPPDLHLLFVGGGECLAQVESLSRERGLAATFTGHVPPEEIPDLIASMDLLVHPSLWEGLPRAPIEALLVGRPVVAFDSDGAREVVIDGITGRLVAPGDVEGLRTAIEEVLCLPDRGRSLVEEGRRRLGDRFGRRAAADRLDELYRRLLADK